MEARDPVLKVRIGERLCALPLAEVQEVFRPLPMQQLAHAPFGVAGLTIVRGEPVPVLDLGPALSGAPSPVGRFVSMKAGGRTLVLAVSEVLGVARPKHGELSSLAPLTRALAPEAITALGQVDQELLAVLSAAHLLSGEAWQHVHHQVPHEVQDDR